jgi:hypothetical protein
MSDVLKKKEAKQKAEKKVRKTKKGRASAWIICPPPKLDEDGEPEDWD